MYFIGVFFVSGTPAVFFSGHFLWPIAIYRNKNKSVNAYVLQTENTKPLIRLIVKFRF